MPKVLFSTNNDETHLCHYENAASPGRVFVVAQNALKIPEKNALERQ